MQRTEIQDFLIQSDLPAFKLTLKHVFPTENPYGVYSRKSVIFLYCCVKAGSINTYTNHTSDCFSAVSTNSNL